MQIMEPESGSSFDEKVKAVAGIFYLESMDGKPVVAVSEAVAGLPASLRKVGDAFAHNVSAAVSTMGIPVTLAHAAARLRLWTQVMAAERIRARIGELEGNPPSEEQVLSRAKEHLDRHLREQNDTFGEDMCDFLLTVLEGINVSSAVSELHAQGLVLMWSAFEVLARDLFVSCLNSRPEFAGRVLGDEKTKRLFQLKGMDFETLTPIPF
jgi:hypothetical protein